MTNTPIVDSVIEYLESRGCETNVHPSRKNHAKPKRKILFDNYYRLRKDSLNNKNLLKNNKNVNQKG